MIRAHLPDGRILNFPDGTDPAVVQATVKRMTAAAPAPPSISPFAESVADSFITNVAPRLEEKRAQLAGVAAAGDINRPPGLLPSHAPSPLLPALTVTEQEEVPPPAARPARLIPIPGQPDNSEQARLEAKREEFDRIRETGDLGHEDFTDVAEPGWFPDPAKQGLSQRSLRETVLDRAFGWAIGGAERAGLLPEGTRAAVRENQQEAFDRYLTAHPEGGLGRASYLALGDMAASAAGPQALLGPGAGALAGRGAAALGAGQGVRVLAGLAGGALEGAGQGLLDTIDLPEEERARMALMGAGMGALGSVHGMVGEKPLSRAPARPDPVLREQARSAHEIELASVRELPPEAQPAALRDVAARSQGEYARLAAAGDEMAGAAADELQAAIAPEVKAPPALDETAYLARRQRALTELPGADDRFVQPGSVREAFRPEGEILGVGRHESRSAQDAALGLRGTGVEELARTALDDSVGPHPPPRPFDDLADEALLNLGVTPAATRGVEPFNAEAGFITLPGRRMAPRPTEPFDALLAPRQTTDRPMGERLQAVADRITDEMLNMEDAPPRLLRRAGLGSAADRMETLLGRGRGSGAWARDVITEGTYAFDPDLDGPGRGGSRRTGNGLQADLAGLDARAAEDLDRLMAAEHHMELVRRQEQAQLAYDWARAQRLEEMRQARRADKESLRAMSGDIRSDMAAALQAARREARARGEYGAFLTSEGRIGRASDLRRDIGPAEASTDLAARRVGNSIAPAGATRSDALRSIRSAQRVALGIRDQATRRIPPAQRPPDIGLTINPEGTRLAQEKLAELNARYGSRPDGRVATLSDLADRVRDWSVRAVLIPLREAGRLSDREFAWRMEPDGSLSYGGDILAKNEFYAPFFRLMEVLGEDPEMLAGTTKGNPLHGISGGLSPDRPIGKEGSSLPVLEGFIEQAQRVHMWTERQRARNFLADQVDASPELQAEVRKLPPEQTGKYPLHVRGTFSAWRNGERSLYAGPEDLIRAFERLTPKQVPLVLQAAQTAVRALRTGVTATLEFAARNPVRDVQNALEYGRGYRPWDFFAGLLDLTGNQRWAQEWKTNGGALSDMVSYQQPDLQATLADALARPNQRLARTIEARWKSENLFGKLVFPLLAPFEAFSGLMERSTKVGAYRRLRLQGDAPLDAAVASRDIGSPDFARGGYVAKAVSNNAVAFFNPEMQGLYRFGRAMRRRPLTTTAKLAAYVTLPAIAHWYYWKDDPEHQSLKPFEKNGFYQIAKRDDGTFWEIPRAPGVENLFGASVERFLDQWYQEDPKGAETFAESVIEQTPAHYVPMPGRPSWDLVPSILKPTLEAAAGEGGWNSYQQRNIVPDPLVEGVLPEDRAMDRTTNLARRVGEKLNVAPLKVDHIIRGYLGRLGRYAAEATGNEAPDIGTTAQDIPLVKGFISTPSIGVASQPVQDLYEMAREAANAKGSLDKAVEAGDVRRYHAVLREHPELALHDALQDAVKELSEMRKARNEVAHAPGLTPELRRDLLLQYDQRIMQWSYVNVQMAARVLAHRP